METLTHTRIEPIGTLKIKSDARPEEFFEGLGSFVTFEPEQGGHSIEAVVVTKEESYVLRELTKLMANPTMPAAVEVKEYLEDRIGAIDWDRVAIRYEQLANGH